MRELLLTSLNVPIEWHSVGSKASSEVELPVRRSGIVRTAQLARSYVHFIVGGF